MGAFGRNDPPDGVVLQIACNTQDILSLLLYTLRSVPVCTPPPSLAAVYDQPFHSLTLQGPSLPQSVGFVLSDMQRTHHAVAC